MALTPTPRVLFFDVFGTVVDWRGTCTQHLHRCAQDTLSKTRSDSSDAHRSAAHAKAATMSAADWGRVAQDWDDAYMRHAASIGSDGAPFSKDNHAEWLRDILSSWDLSELWSPEEVERISTIWRRLDGWPDSAQGIKAFNQKFLTATLTNGSVDLMREMAQHAGLEWGEVVSAQEFETYKPSKKVYLGAFEKIKGKLREKGEEELKLEECVLVAAHLYDLEAAKRCGYQTIYVERGEERADEAEVARMRQEGIVDLWVTAAEDGFLTVAEKLGCKLDSS